MARLFTATDVERAARLAATKSLYTFDPARVEDAVRQALDVILAEAEPMYPKDVVLKVATRALCNWVRGDRDDSACVVGRAFEEIVNGK